METKKSKYEVNKKYAEKYNAQFDKITVRVKPETKQAIQERAAAAGKSVNQYIIDKALEA